MPGRNAAPLTNETHKVNSKKQYFAKFGYLQRPEPCVTWCEMNAWYASCKSSAEGRMRITKRGKQEPAKQSAVQPGGASSCKLYCVTPVGRLSAHAKLPRARGAVLRVFNYFGRHQEASTMATTGPTDACIEDTTKSP